MNERELYDYETAIDELEELVREDDTVDLCDIIEGQER